LDAVGALRSANFLWLLASTMSASLGTGMQLTAIGWLALEESGGAFAVGVVLAARMLPNLLFGLASGTLADHADRRRLLVFVRLVSIVPALGLALVATAGTGTVWPLAVLAFATGSTTVFDMPTRQALVMDTAPRELAANAMALNATMSRLFVAAGALAAGAITPSLGVAACFVATGAVFVAATILSLAVKPRPTGESRLTMARPPFGQALAQAGLLALHFAEVRTLLVAAVACEIFGFSYQTAVPVFARDILGAGAEGLGTLNAATSIGGAGAVVVLSLIPGRVPRQPVLAVIFVVYGAALLLLAPSTTLQLASAALLVVGACAGCFDVLQQTLMQLAVPEAQRGRAVGLWVLGIGSAPVGNLEMGALVAALGAPMALAINGGLVLVAAGVLVVRAPAYRRLSWRPVAAED
jgi:MFS family permease